MIRFYPIKTPSIFKSIFSKWIWKLESSKKEVYLTFDDGPIPEVTPWVLELLEQYNAKATFFCIGDNVKKHPEIYSLLKKKGHQTGNHTFHHLKGWKTNTNSYIANVLATEKLIQNTTKLFRPPYGKLKLKQAKALQDKGYKIVMWSILSGDFDKNITSEKCTQNVLKNIENGSIVVFHDSLKAFPRLKETLPCVLEELTKKGFSFKAIS